ncbi:unnamed protein product [Natator depressus]
MRSRVPPCDKLYYKWNSETPSHQEGMPKQHGAGVFLGSDTFTLPRQHMEGQPEWQQFQLQFLGVPKSRRGLWRMFNERYSQISWSHWPAKTSRSSNGPFRYQPDS